MISLSWQGVWPCTAETRPGVLEMVQVGDWPGLARFIGLGQLPSDAFRVLWDQRRTVSARQLAEGAAVWRALRAPDPTGLAEAALAGFSELAFMAAALRRHCQEFPWIEDGLSLTERLVLRLLAERPCTMGQIFHELMTEREPLPWLGDTMLRFILDSMKRVDRPVFFSEPAGDGQWFRERLTITELGRAVLNGTVDFLSLHPPERFLGGVAIGDSTLSWRWDDGARMVVNLSS